MQDKTKKIVLVSVLKNKRDLNLLLKENWYRIPIKHAPKRPFSYLAFYQPAVFGCQGKCIKYYARVLNYQIKKRKNLLPNELNHLRASEDYWQIHLGPIKKLPQPIKNIVPRRICFGFTILNRLLKSKNILQLYNITPTEQIIKDCLRQEGIKADAQHHVLIDKKSRSRDHSMLRRRRYCLDFAIFCQKGKIAIECDNKKAHSSPSQKRRDRIKDTFLRRDGWTVIRLPEDKIISDLPGCLKRIKRKIQKFGGPRTF